MTATRTGAVDVQQVPAAITVLSDATLQRNNVRDINDLPHEAIAAEHGISTSAAKVRLHRARRKLREELFPLPGDTDAASSAGSGDGHAH